MNIYRILGLSLLVTFVLLIILTFRFGLSNEERDLILTFETAVGFSLMQFRIFIAFYFIILSLMVFRVSRRINLTIGFFWLYVSLLILPLTIFTIFIMFLEWTTSLFSEAGVPGGYYDDINHYGHLNLLLIILNVLGLLIFGFKLNRQLKSTSSK